MADVVEQHCHGVSFFQSCLPESRTMIDCVAARDAAIRNFIQFENPICWMADLPSDLIAPLLPNLVTERSTGHLKLAIQK